MALKLRRHPEMLVFCSMSKLKSRKDSSREVTVSQHRHLVSLVSVPWNTSCTHVLAGGDGGARP